MNEPAPLGIVLLWPLRLLRARWQRHLYSPAAYHELAHQLAGRLAEEQARIEHSGTGHYPGSAVLRYDVATLALQAHEVLSRCPEAQAADPDALERLAELGVTYREPLPPGGCAAELDDLVDKLGLRVADLTAFGPLTALGRRPPGGRGPHGISQDVLHYDRLVQRLRAAETPPPSRYAHLHARRLVTYVRDRTHRWGGIHPDTARIVAAAYRDHLATT